MSRSSRHRMKGATISTIALLLSKVDASPVATALVRSARAIANAPKMTSYRQFSSSAFVSSSNLTRKRPRYQPHGSCWMPNDIISVAPPQLSINFQQKKIRPIASTTTPLHAKPKSGSIVDSYQTVSVNCSKCRTRLFRYKKKNGTKSNLVKCYIERISEDSAGVLESMGGIDDGDEEDVGGAEALEGQEWSCPDCGQRFGRRTLIHGRPAIKLVGGKVRMTKK